MCRQERCDTSAIFAGQENSPRSISTNSVSHWLWLINVWIVLVLPKTYKIRVKASYLICFFLVYTYRYVKAAWLKMLFDSKLICCSHPLPGMWFASHDTILSWDDNQSGARQPPKSRHPDCEICKTLKHVTWTLKLKNDALQRRWHFTDKCKGSHPTGAVLLTVTTSLKAMYFRKILNTSSIPTPYTRSARILWEQVSHLKRTPNLKR